MRTKTVKNVDSFVPAGEGGGYQTNHSETFPAVITCVRFLRRKCQSCPLNKSLETDGTETSLAALMAFYFCPGMKKKGKNATSSFSIPRVRKHH